ncbi:MAG: hypothetical protein LW809_04400 [Vampirovibrionales bacterium]|jgi:glycine/D-amino acid oxidase-like deaminating enzyme|nr:hypothetical protein [Vampirovibrionales bacterium]
MSFPSPAFDESQFLAIPSPFERVTIIGAGLIGGSFAWLMRERFGSDKLHITLVDKDEKTLQLALRKGIAGWSDAGRLTNGITIKPCSRLCKAGRLKIYASSTHAWCKILTPWVTP